MKKSIRSKNERRGGKRGDTRKMLKTKDRDKKMRNGDDVGKIQRDVDDKGIKEMISEEDAEKNEEEGEDKRSVRKS